MADVVSPQVVDSVTIDNVKTIAGSAAAANANLAQMAASAAGLSIQNAVSQQQAMQQISNAIVTQAVNLLLNADPSEAISVSKEMSGNDLGQQLAQLLAVIASNQQSSKAAGNTPPVTPDK